jgi:hypothetical protein
VVQASAGMVDTRVGRACEVEPCSHRMVEGVDSMVDTDHGSMVVVQESCPVLSYLMAEHAQAAAMVCLHRPVTSLQHPSSGDPWTGKESALLLMVLEC